LDFEIKQNILINNLETNYSLALQLFRQNLNEENRVYFQLPNIRYLSFNKINDINLAPKPDIALLNKKTQRDGDGNEAKESSAKNKRSKIFSIKKIKDREKEAAEEKKIKKYIYRGSKYRGVSRNGKTWQVLIMINRNKNYIGNFKSEVEAAKAYDEYAMKYHKNKARLNFSHQGFIKYVNKP
jgi:hypothetical protein